MYLSDDVRLRHMRDAAREAIGFAEGKSRDALDSDRQLVLALAKCIEIIGEAATHVSEETMQRCPSIPWPQIKGVRNRLIHGYFDIDLDRVWDTVQDDLPSLIASLEAALGAEKREEETDDAE